MKLFIRKEINNEYRAPLIPEDCGKLVCAGYEIFVEHSKNRCFSDEEYLRNGCELVNKPPDSAIIIGLKEITNPDFYRFKNMYFAHCYKNQSNAKNILSQFAKNNGVIYDYEYIVDADNKRLIAFGFWAGFMGTCLGICQYLQKINSGEDLNNLKPIRSHEILEILYKVPFRVNIGIIGINGRCGQGCRSVLDKLMLEYKSHTRGCQFDLYDCDIIINCIHLKPYSQDVFISKDNLHRFPNLKVIVDVSCDVNASNNPIQLDYKVTNIYKPVCKYKHIDIIAIDNLPTLLPKESSTEFSHKLVELIPNKDIWDNLEVLFRTHSRINV